MARVTHPTTENSRLPLFIALAVALMIVYVSLEPFAGWHWPESNLITQFLGNEGRRKWLPFDLLVNAAIYIPLGFGLMGVQRSAPHALLLATLLSLSLELTQAALPTRQSSLIDWLSNTCGAILGIALYAAYAGATTLRTRAHRARRYLLPGARGDFGIIILLIFLFAHINPGQPLFASTFLVPEDRTTEPGLALLQTAHTMLNFIAIGLFADLLVRTRVSGGIMMITTLLIAVASKSLLAAMLLRPGAWGAWLSAPVLLGMVIAALALTVLFWLPASRKRVICNIAAIVALVLPVLAPDWLFAKAPLRAFDWHYGHLLNFNSLSQTLLRIWPLLVSVYLLTTAGNPYQDPKAASASPPS